MKTTVKDFILDNMTEENYESLVHYLVENKLLDFMIGNFDIDDIEIDEFLNNERLQDIKNIALKKLTKIEKRFKSNREANELDKKPALKAAEENSLVDEIDFFEFENFEIDPLPIDPYKEEINASNYKTFFAQERARTDNKLAKFIYDIMNYESDEKKENKIEGYTNEKSHVKIDNNNKLYDGYCVHILLDNRTHYFSSKAYESYAFMSNNLDIRNADLSSEIIPRGFVEYDLLEESLSWWQGDYMLDPFTSYLNEEITIPEKLSEVAIDSLLEMFIVIFTHAGNLFTVEEQIEINKDYDGGHNRPWGAIEK